jgi:DNA-binding transcriptional LysR family regulator
VLTPALHGIEIIREPFRVIMRNDHTLSKRRRISVAALTKESFVFYGERMGQTLPHQVLSLCRAAGFEPQIGQLANGNATITGLVAAGLGIAVVPEAMCKLYHKSVISRPLDTGGFTTSIWLLRLSRDESPLVNAFWKLVTGKCGAVRA